MRSFEKGEDLSFHVVGNLCVTYMKGLELNPRVSIRCSW